MALKSKFAKTYLLVIISLFSLTNVYSKDAISEKIEFGRNLMTLHKFEDAVKVFDTVLTKDQTNPDALFNKGLCLFRLDSFNLALPVLNKLIKVVPEISDAYNLRGLVYLNLKDTNLADKDFSKAIEIDPKFAVAMLNKAKILLDKGKDKEGYALLLKASQYDTTNAELYFQKARAEHALGKYEDAIKDFNNAIDYNYFNSDIIYRRANSYYKAKKYEDAIKDYTQVILWEPLNILAYNNRAFAYDAVGDSLYAKQDKQVVSDINLSATLDPNKAKLQTFYSQDSSFSILLPEDFKMHQHFYKDSIVADFYPDSLLTYDNRIGIKVKIIPYFSKIIGSNEPADIIEKWRNTQDSIAGHIKYYRYQPAERISKTYHSYPSILYKILIQKDIKSIASINWNYAIAYSEHLVEISFVMPLALYNYYSQIFQKTISSFQLIKIPKKIKDKK